MKIKTLFNHGILITKKWYVLNFISNPPSPSCCHFLLCPPPPLPSNRIPGGS